MSFLISYHIITLHHLYQLHDKNKKFSVQRYHFVCWVRINFILQGNLVASKFQAEKESKQLSPFDHYKSPPNCPCLNCYVGWVCGVLWAQWSVPSHTIGHIKWIIHMYPIVLFKSKFALLISHNMPCSTRREPPLQKKWWAQTTRQIIIIQNLLILKKLKTS